MTLYEAVTAATSIGALLAVSISVWLFRRQLKIMSDQNAHLTQALEMSAESALDVLFVTVTQAYLEHPELRSLFNEGENGLDPAPPDRASLQRAAAVAETLSDAMERSLRFEDEGLPQIAAPLRQWIEDSFRQSRFLREWLSAHRRWYDDSLLAVLDSVEHERATAKPAPSDEVSRHQPGCWRKWKAVWGLVGGGGGRGANRRGW